MYMYVLSIISSLLYPALEEPSLLECVIQCYHHLLSFLPDTTPYLASCSSLVTTVIASDQEKLSTRELLSRYVSISLDFFEYKHLPGYLLTDYA